VRPEFLRPRKKEKGQALVEFSLMLPILLVVVIGLSYVCVLFFSYLTLQSAVREGAYKIVTNGKNETDSTIQDWVRTKSFALSNVTVVTTPSQPTTSDTAWSTPRIRITVEAWYTVPFPTVAIPLPGNGTARMGPIRIYAKSNMTTE
jgi:Flp pilus assembly protein TadG